MICATYVPFIDRNPIDKEICGLFFICYNYHLVLDSTMPTSCCNDCKASMHVCLNRGFNYEVCKLKISNPAIFLKCKPDHSDYFFCQNWNEFYDEPFSFRSVSVLKPLFN